MSQDVTDIRGERADFASGDRGGVIFYRFVSSKKDLYDFLGGLFERLRAPSQKAKGPFPSKTNL